ncbi:hypothetical protein DY000_02038837 [Brassica cretica]|uniref:Reverse transcriptase zinc-binding domain-containing protein n=1 Tax=Brassica cretica TaxID=69181 RepID=A0ABQ7BJN4_BRACR|nr:hypothetical protein DY000_02038837 [Brassica cretica]
MGEGPTQCGYVGIRRWFSKAISQTSGPSNQAPLTPSIPKTTTVASLYQDDHWLLPPKRTENQEVYGKICERFSTGEIYTYIQGPKPTIPWASVVWCSYGIPRHSFLTWPVMLDRFPTKDRLLRWGMEGVDPACLLCNSEVENRNHLFFDCSYNSLVWSSIAHHCQLQAPSNRDDNIHMLGNKDLRRLTILSHQASIYWLWNE